jgi:hypothetical protein
MKTINISEETYEAIKDQLTTSEQVEISDMQDFVGKKLFIRTVTFHLVGKVEKIVGNLMELSNASWVADSGRFMNAIKDGTLDEVEPVGQMWVNTSSVIDISNWNHDLPNKQS